MEICKKLIVQVLDFEKKISPSIFEKINEVLKFLSIQQQLDLVLLYMRRVHAFCFYCGEEYDDERMLAAKCGP